MGQTFKDDGEGLQSKAHSFLADFSNWIDFLDDRLETVLLKSALKEYQFGLLAVVQGQYRHSFMALRFFLEQTLAAIHFSVKELELRQWMQGEKDIYWENISNEENGVFSSCFVKVFCPSMLEEVGIIRGLAKKVYRDCSEYIHGNYCTHGKLPEGLEYRKDIYEDWHDRAETARFIISFALYIRYSIILNDKPKKARMESTIMEYLGHIPAIHEFYSE
jgi:hypothetical protein